MTELETGWTKYFEYVLATIERLADAVSLNEKEISSFREKLIRDLTRLKDDIRVDINRCQVEGRTDLDKIWSKIDKLVMDLSSRTMMLEKSSPEYMIDKKISALKEEHITPIRIKVAVLSILLGAVGGIVVQLITQAFGTWAAS